MMVIRITSCLLLLIVAHYCALESNDIHEEIRKSNDVNIVAFWGITMSNLDSSYLTEQMYVMSTSGLMDAIDHLYYVTNGEGGSELAIVNPKASHWKHIDYVDESTVLNEIYIYCHSNINSKVVYFHNNHMEVDFRRALDCYVLNPKCISMLDQYDTCGWRFSPAPYLHYTGNYWWATCKHINKLIDPLSYTHNQTFATLTHDQIEPGHHHHDEQRKTKSKGDYPKLGLGKYFSDSWVGSLPVYSPADCMGIEVETRYLGGLPIPWFAVQPYCPNFNTDFSNKVLKWSKVSNDDKRALPTVKYGLKCSKASVLEHPGSFADTVLDKHSMVNFLMDPVHIERITKRTVLWYGQPPLLQLNWLKQYTLRDGQLYSYPPHTEPQVVAFYNVYAQGPYYADIVREQTYTIKASGLLNKLDAIYYATIGDKGKEYKIPGDKYKHLIYFGLKADEMLTVGKLYDYCKIFPQDKVLYFHNKGSYNNHITNLYFRLGLDCFVLNPNCIQTLDTHDICGWRVSLLPHVHFSGNYWWATCKHINRLIDPLSPTRNQTFLAVTSTINPHRKYKNDHRFHDYPNLGLGRFFAESWIGSAPVIKIADCMSADREEQYTGGYEIPYYTLIQVCDNFHKKFKNKTIIYEDAISNNDVELPKIKLGMQCTSSQFYNEPSRFKKAIDKSLSDFNFVTKYLKLLIKRSILWYGEKPITQLEWLAKLNIFAQRK